jgi:negative regulator of flagellin synthesis FlgM
MATKIEAYSAAAAGSQTSAPRAVSAVGKSGSSAAGNSVQSIDSVQLTPDALQLSQLEKSISSIPVANNQRVAQVRQAVNDGSYKIDPQSVASKLTRMEWDLAN